MKEIVVPDAFMVQVEHARNNEINVEDKSLVPYIVSMGGSAKTSSQEKKFKGNHIDFWRISS